MWAEIVSSIFYVKWDCEVCLCKMCLPSYFSLSSRSFSLKWAIQGCLFIDIQYVWAYIRPYWAYIRSIGQRIYACTERIYAIPVSIQLRALRMTNWPPRQPKMGVYTLKLSVYTFKMGVYTLILADVYLLLTRRFSRIFQNTVMVWVDPVFLRVLEHSGVLRNNLESSGKLRTDFRNYFPTIT